MSLQKTCFFFTPNTSRVKTTICFYLRRAYCALQSIHIFLVQVPRNFASDEKELSRQLSRSDLELHSPLPTLLSRSSRLGDFGWLSFVCGALRAAIIPAFFSLCFRNNHFERDPGCPGDPRVDVNRKRVSKFLTRGELVWKACRKRLLKRSRVSSTVKIFAKKGGGEIPPCKPVSCCFRLQDRK